MADTSTELAATLEDVSREQRTIDAAQARLEAAACLAIEQGASARDVARARNTNNPAWVYAVLRRHGADRLIAPYVRQSRSAE